METKIIQMIEVLEERLAGFEAEYAKTVKEDYDESSWATTNRRGFYNGLRTATKIELGHLQELLCFNAKLRG
jgi:hypothetical protein